jgi:hypothetical protein
MLNVIWERNIKRRKKVTKLKMSEKYLLIIFIYRIVNKEFRSFFLIFKLFATKFLFLLLNLLILLSFYPYQKSITYLFAVKLELIQPLFFIFKHSDFFIFQPIVVVFRSNRLNPFLSLIVLPYLWMFIRI